MSTLLVSCVDVVDVNCHAPAIRESTGVGSCEILKSVERMVLDSRHVEDVFTGKREG